MSQNTLKLIFCFLLLITCQAVSQNNYKNQSVIIDSLKNSLKLAKNDTSRCNILVALLNLESDDNIWPLYNRQIKNICENNLHKIGKKFNLSIQQEALYKFYLKKLSGVFNNEGFLFSKIGDLPNSIQSYYKSLKIREDLNDTLGISNVLNNIGAIYQYQKEFDKAKEYYERGFKLYETIKDTLSMGISLNNIGTIYLYQKNYKEALNCFEKELYFFQKKNYTEGEASAKINIGTVQENQNKLQEAEANYYKSFYLFQKINDKEGMSSSLRNIGNIKISQGKINEAKKFAEESMSISKSLNKISNIIESSKQLSIIYSSIKNYKNAYEMSVLHKKLSDSISNENNKKQIIQKSFQYQFDRKVVEDSLKISEERKIINLKLHEEKTKKTALYIIILTICLFSLFLYSRFRIIKRQKAQIEIKEKETIVQKNIIEQKHKEITDSINYAERIQRSFLATKETLDKHLKEYFILFKPKDVVSGDFYWASELKNGNFAFVTADSTGHGVPGAIMSLLNITSLEKAIEFYSSPSDILNHTRSNIIKRLKLDGSEEGGKDGMDCSIVVFDFKNKKILVSLANNPIWILRDKNIMEIKPDKMPVGKHERENSSFNESEVKLENGDIIYTLTDGFQDQFGGKENKKYLVKNLRKLILENGHLSMQKQKEVLDEELKKWTDGNEQTDDVTIVGIKYA